MIQEQTTLSYKDQIVFERIRMSQFKRIPKLYQDNEACFMFINKGAFSVRTPDEFISFVKDKILVLDPQKGRYILKMRHHNECNNL